MTTPITIEKTDEEVATNVARFKAKFGAYYCDRGDRERGNGWSEDSRG